MTNKDIQPDIFSINSIITVRHNSPIKNIGDNKQIIPNICILAIILLLKNFSFLIDILNICSNIKITKKGIMHIIANIVILKRETPTPKAC